MEAGIKSTENLLEFSYDVSYPAYIARIGNTSPGRAGYSEMTMHPTTAVELYEESRMGSLLHTRFRYFAHPTNVPEEVTLDLEDLHRTQKTGGFYTLYEFILEDNKIHSVRRVGGSN